jgi:hypothetical protein
VCKCRTLIWKHKLQNNFHHSHRHLYISPFRRVSDSQQSVFDYHKTNTLQGIAMNQVYKTIDKNIFYSGCIAAMKIEMKGIDQGGNPFSFQLQRKSKVIIHSINANYRSLHLYNCSRHGLKIVLAQI